MNGISEEPNANEFTRQAWNANAAFWDEKMGEGNEFFNILVWPSILRLLDPQPGQRILDIATGNGLTARRLAKLGAKVTAFDFSAELIKLAKSRTDPSLPVSFFNMDATNEGSMLSTFGPSDSNGEPGTSPGFFDSALCNMALFDIVDIEPLFRVLPRLLKAEGKFVFSILHPAFNNCSCVHLAEEIDAGGKIKTTYSIKISEYLTIRQAYGAAKRDQPRPQLYFDRPLQYYLNLGFKSGFLLDGFEECAFPPNLHQEHPLGWGGNFSEIPPVLIARMILQ